MFGGPNGTDCLATILALHQRGELLDPEDEPPAETPLACQILWEIHSEIRSGIGPGMMGPSMITWQDLQAYQNVTGLQLDDWAIRQIRQIDAMLIAASRKANG